MKNLLLSSDRFFYDKICNKMNKIYLHLGSNVGDRKKILNEALTAIDRAIGNIKSKSSVYETEPWGLKDQENFLNLAVFVESKLSLDEVFNLTKSIEQDLGTGKEKKWGPRSLDIDILYYNDDIVNTDKLTIPHANLYQRNFVLIPLMEIAGDLIDPVEGKTIEELYDECHDECEVFIFED